MLTSRKSLTNLIQTADGPFIIHFRYWFQSKFKEGSTVKISFGKKLPVTINSPFPQEKYVIMDIVSRHQMPVCKIQSPDGSTEIQLKKYMPGLSKQYSVYAGKTKLVFILQILSTTVDISNIYASDQASEEQRIRYEQSINDLIRSEAQFVSKYQKDEEIEQVNKKQQIEQEIQNKLTTQLGSIKSIDFNIKNLILIFVLFVFIGYLIDSPNPVKRNSRKKIKKKRY